METEFVCQGRRLSAAELAWLRSALATQPGWSRKRWARELCQRWQWRTAQGRLKDFAARSLLLKLEARGLVRLPPLRQPLRTRRWAAEPAFEVPPTQTGPPEVRGPVGQFEPLRWVLPWPGSSEEGRFHGYVQRHHYLGLRVVGENLKYLVQSAAGTDLACLLFGAAAWQVGARDRFIGWTATQRAQGLAQVVNNTRFLILPWVQVHGLASRVLSRTLQRLPVDWQRKYGHPVFLVETFVDRARFAGTCYQAANWQRIGQTQGRGRQGPAPQKCGPSIKEILVYPLHRNFRQRLVAPPSPAEAP